MNRAPAPADPRATLLAAARGALAKGDFDRARAMLGPALRALPDDPALLSLAGLAHRGLGDLLGAIALLERAVKRAPDLLPTRFALTDALIEANRPARAIATLDALPPQERGARPASLLRATALGKLGDQPGEAAELRRLVSEFPEDPSLRLRLGHTLRAMGQVDEAIAQYRSIFAIDAASGAAWWALANIKSAAFDETDRAAMRAALAAPVTSDTDRIRLGFALARAEEVAGNHAAAFEQYAAANDRRLARSKYDPDAFEAHLAAAEALFTPAFFTARADHGAPSDAPLFIVGMQRSGSTLIEQMLSSHTRIEGTAELPYINQLALELQRDARMARRSFGDHVAALDAAATRKLGEAYLDRASPHRRTDRPIFLDKMPNNWAHLGLIRLILPNARVVDVRRHPLACGFSNYRQLYGSGLEHSYSLNHWGRYYRAYLAHMAHWDRVQPGWVTHIIYEQLVDEPERILAHLAAALGIDFDPAMLDFHLNDRTVRTISAEQVRRPLHRGAVDEWRRFEPWLGPLKTALGPALDTWNAPQDTKA